MGKCCVLRDEHYCTQSQGPELSARLLRVREELAAASRGRTTSAIHGCDGLASRDSSQRRSSAQSSETRNDACSKCASPPRCTSAAHARQADWKIMNEVSRYLPERQRTGRASSGRDPTPQRKRTQKKAARRNELDAGVYSYEGVERWGK